MIASQFQERSVIYKFIRLHQQIYPIEKMCKVMELVPEAIMLGKIVLNALVALKLKFLKRR